MKRAWNVEKPRNRLLRRKPTLSIPPTAAVRDMESSGTGSVASRSMTTLHRPLLQYTISSTLSLNAFKGSNSTLYFNLKLDPSDSISSTGRMRRARSIRFLCLRSDLISSVKSERTGSESVDSKSALFIPDKRIYCKKKDKSGGEKEERRREK